tara:strand:- start:59478 stop:59825 length:348 start_codon:yes stop_codon:yes gene_type:complete
MLKSFQKAMIIESASGQSARNRALEAKALEYLSSNDITLRDMFDVADAVEDVLVPRHAYSMKLVLDYSPGEVVTLKSALNYEHIETNMSEKVVNLPQANAVRNLFLELKGLAFIA